MNIWSKNMKSKDQKIEFLNFYKMLKNIRLLISEEEKLKQHGVRVKIIGNVFYVN